MHILGVLNVQSQPKGGKSWNKTHSEALGMATWRVKIFAYDVIPPYARH